MKNTELQRQRDLLSLTEHAIAQQEDFLQGARIAHDASGTFRDATRWKRHIEKAEANLKKYKTWHEEAKAKINQLQN